MKTEKAIELMRSAGQDREARVLEAALAAVRSGGDPGMHVDVDARIRINGVMYWVWDLGDELLDAYFSAVRAAVSDHIAKVLEVRASVDTVHIEARRV